MSSRYDSLTAGPKKHVYMPYFTLGYPTEALSLKVIRTLIEEGVDGLELGLPFRDAVADGPIIQAAANQALDRGFTVDKALELVRKIRALAPTLPLTLMCYYNMLVARGVEKFIRDFAKAGIDGILIPDLPPERAEEILPAAKKHGVQTIFIASLLSDAARLKTIAAVASGFVYVVPRLGITGLTQNFDEDLAGVFKRIRKATPLPLIAGFGIAEPAHATQMFEAGATGAISGSKVVKLVTDAYAKDKKTDFASLRRHTRQMLKTTG
jgi:tryptophan synthase alpha chain